MNRYGNVFHFNFILLSRCAGWLEVCQDFLFGDLGQVLALPATSGGAQLTAPLCSYFLFGGQSKALVRSWILLAKDLFLWIEFKIREYFQWNKASVLIMKIETSFVGMSATHPTLSRGSAVNQEEKIINENSHKTLFKGSELLALLFNAIFSFLCVGST